MFEVHSGLNVLVDTLPRSRASQEADWPTVRDDDPQEGTDSLPEALKLLVVSNVGGRNVLLSSYCSLGTTSTYYSAWYEWFPYGWTRITSLPIVPGDDLFVEVWSTTSTAGHAYFVNHNTNQYVVVNFSAPPGFHLVGNSAEWIVERPAIGGSLATLTNYISDYFSDAYACTFGYRAVDPGSAGSFPEWHYRTKLPQTVRSAADLLPDRSEYP